MGACMQDFWHLHLAGCCFAATMREQCTGNTLLAVPVCELDMENQLFGKLSWLSLLLGVHLGYQRVLSKSGALPRSCLCS